MKLDRKYECTVKEWMGVNPKSGLTGISWDSRTLNDPKAMGIFLPPKSDFSDGCVRPFHGILGSLAFMTFQKQLGMSSSQLTLTPSFFRGVGIPPTSNS